MTHENCEQPNCVQAEIVEPAGPPLILRNEHILCCGACDDAYLPLVVDGHQGGSAIVGLICPHCEDRLWIRRRRVLDEPPFLQRLKLLVGGAP